MNKFLVLVACVISMTQLHSQSVFSPVTPSAHMSKISMQAKSPDVASIVFDGNGNAIHCRLSFGRSMLPDSLILTTYSKTTSVIIKRVVTTEFLSLPVVLINDTLFSSNSAALISDTVITAITVNNSVYLDKCINSNKLPSISVGIDIYKLQGVMSNTITIKNGIEYNFANTPDGLFIYKPNCIYQYTASPDTSIGNIADTITGNIIVDSLVCKLVRTDTISTVGAIKWSISDTTIATINSNGKITPIKSDSVTVKAVCLGVTFIKRIYVSANTDTIDTTDTNTGIIKQKQEKHCLVFPNPATQYIYTNAMYKQLTIFDMLGRVVLVSVNNEPTIFIGDLQPGMYVVMLDNDYTYLIKK